jgi:divalent metal cation (Fe/Co/Zn/Cd) transporter
MAKYSNALAKKIKSDVLKADAWHHRSDALSSIGVAIGILAAGYGFPVLDPIFGIIVSIFIIYIGIKLVRTSSNFLMGQSPDKELTKQIESLAQKTENVVGIHDISIHDYGTTKILTLHAEVNSNLPLNKAHKIADILDEKIRSKTNYSTIIHLDPKETQYDKKEKKQIIETILNNQKEIISFHKIQIIHRDGGEDIKMHLIVDKDMPIKVSHELCHRLELSLVKIYGSCNVDIHFEPCIKNCNICTISCKKRIT